MKNPEREEHDRLAANVEPEPTFDRRVGFFEGTFEGSDHQAGSLVPQFPTLDPEGHDVHLGLDSHSSWCLLLISSSLNSFSRALMLTDFAASA
jgi:hypothetical protein